MPSFGQPNSYPPLPKRRSCWVDMRQPNLLILLIPLILRIPHLPDFPRQRITRRGDFHVRAGLAGVGVVAVAVELIADQLVGAAGPGLVVLGRWGCGRRRRSGGRCRWVVVLRCAVAWSGRVGWWGGGWFGVRSVTSCTIGGTSRRGAGRCYGSVMGAAV